MPITVQCPGCGSQFRANDKLAGRRGKCPKCSGEIEVPKLAAEHFGPQRLNERNVATLQDTASAINCQKASDPMTQEPICFFCGNSSSTDSTAYQQPLCRVIRVEGTDALKTATTIALGGIAGAFTRGKTVFYHKRLVRIPRCERCSAVHEAHTAYQQKLTNRGAAIGAIFLAFTVGVLVFIGLVTDHNKNHSWGDAVLFVLFFALFASIFGAVIGGGAGWLLGWWKGQRSGDPAMPLDSAKSFPVISAMLKAGWVIGDTPTEPAGAVFSEVPDETAPVLVPNKRAQFRSAPERIECPVREPTEVRGSELRYCRRCGTTTPHVCNSGITTLAVFLMFPLAIGIMVALEKIGITGVSMSPSERAMVIAAIFGCSAYLSYLVLHRLTTTCQTCKKKPKH
jgi:hypothetical protein